MIGAIKGPVNIPDLSIYTLLSRNTEVSGSRPVMIYYDKYITYSRILSYVDSMAYQLEHRLNIGKGDTVGILLDFSPEYVISIISSIKIGAKVLVIDENTDEKIINNYVEYHKIKVLIMCKRMARLATASDVKYIISDPNDFLTLGKAVIRRIKYRSRVRYSENILKFYEFIYSGKKSDKSENPETSCIMFYSDSRLIKFSMKDIISFTFILNYWMPKIDGRPVFYSNIRHSTPLGLVYSITLPVSFSGATVVNRIGGILKNSPDFIIGDKKLYSSIIDKHIYLNGVKYCIMPFNDVKTETEFNKFTGVPLITGRSDNITLTTHMNPFDDIRKGSFGMPLNYVKYDINNIGEMLVKTPYMPEIFMDGKKISEEWVNTHIRVKIVDGYFYSV
ncbi:MAG: AMP-binding protein [Ferroplasma sp.]|uniref:AMP-binding protein n=1 Tax=Ferroplasma sp. TaxID=2591003 RepID=UPI0028162724|nr:AMP-binding protein [Ferroplasma sp.]WMT51644.1 MAG: AMP-binding protein [Ferroplasma sp.]